MAAVGGAAAQVIAVPIPELLDYLKESDQRSDSGGGQVSTSLFMLAVGISMRMLSRTVTEEAPPDDPGDDARGLLEGGPSGRAPSERYY